METTESYDTVIIGSGFGGTISALTLAKYCKETHSGQVCLLERGQWWLSHEIPFTPKEKWEQGHSANILEYLVDKDQPFNFWAHPDNVEGLLNLLSITRNVNERGIYDLSILSKNVNVITASGVGGGSLVYSNVTVEPDSTIFERWPIQKSDLASYFDIARKFIGVNKIITVSALTTQKLDRPKIFQSAIKKLQEKDNNIIKEDDYSLDLSITDISLDKIKFPELGNFNSIEEYVKNADNLKKLEEYINKTENLKKHYDNPFQTNVCQRQARCNIGCLPGARHTLNKRLFSEAKKDNPTLIIKPLCESYKLEFHEKDEYPYVIHYYDHQNNKEKKKIQTKRLVICSGSLGTTKLLLNSKDEIKFSKKLGHNFSINADMLAYAEFIQKRIDNTRGPINTSHVKFKDANNKFAFNIEDTAVPLMTAGIFAKVFENNLQIKSGLSFVKKISLAFKIGNIGLMRGDPAFFRNLIKTLKNHPLVKNFITEQKVVDKNNPNIVIKDRDEKFRERMKFFYKLADLLISDQDRPFDSAAQRLSKYFIFSCMGIDKSNMKLELNPNNEKTLKLNETWKPSDDKEIFNKMTDAVQKIANEIEAGSSVNTVGWNKDDPDSSSFFVLHPMGGCPMAKTIDEGVVNSFGQVFRADGKDKTDTFPNFYILDGSIIPSALGVNPSLTIMALTFRGLEHMLESKEFWP